LQHYRLMKTFSELQSVQDVSIKYMVGINTNKFINNNFTPFPDPLNQFRQTATLPSYFMQNLNWLVQEKQYQCLCFSPL